MVFVKLFYLEMVGFSLAFHPKHWFVVLLNSLRASLVMSSRVFWTFLSNLSSLFLPSVFIFLLFLSGVLILAFRQLLFFRLISPTVTLLSLIIVHSHDALVSVPLQPVTAQFHANLFLGIKHFALFFLQFLLLALDCISPLSANLRGISFTRLAWPSLKGYEF